MSEKSYFGFIQNDTLPVEHVGDLTHRMAQYPTRPDYYCGYELVKPKVTKSLSILTDPYGFEREMNENSKANADYRNISLVQYQEVLDNQLIKYTIEHKKLKVYNIAQWYAREAAIRLGTKEWQKSINCLKILKANMFSPEKWCDYAGTFDPDFYHK